MSAAKDGAVTALERRVAKLERVVAELCGEGATDAEKRALAVLLAGVPPRLATVAPRVAPQHECLTAGQASSQTAEDRATVAR